VTRLRDGRPGLHSR